MITVIPKRRVGRLGWDVQTVPVLLPSVIDKKLANIRHEKSEDSNATKPIIRFFQDSPNGIEGWPNVR
jgi:hypothetical protein